MAHTYTVKEVARILGYSTNSIYTFLKENRIQGIRVGKGRFRISESELNRLLQITKSMKPGNSVAVSDTERQQVYAQPVTPTVAETILKSVAPPRIGVPSILDWFTGVASILLAVSMVFFSQYLDEFAYPISAAWIPAIAISLLTAAVGLLLSDMIGKSGSVWHNVFSGLLGLMYAVMAYLSWLKGDVTVAVTYGGLVLTVVSTLIFGIDALFGFLLFVVLFAIILPVVMLPAIGEGITSFLGESWWSPQYLTVSATVLGLAWGCFVLWSVFLRRTVFSLALVVTAFAGVMAAVVAAQSLSWGWSMFILLLSLTILYLPVWVTLEFAHQKDRKAVYQAFGTVLLVFVSALILLRLIHTSMIEYASNQLSDKVQFGIVSVEKDFEKAQVSLESASQNTVLQESIGGDDSETAAGILRGLYEGNRTFTALFVASASGEVLTAYPIQAIASGTNVRDESYAQSLVQSRTTVVENRMNDDRSIRKPEVVIAVPVHGKRNELAGMLVGSIDVGILGSELQRIAKEESGEYFILSDRYGVILAHPRKQLIGSDLPSGHPLRQASSGHAGSDRTLDDAGKRVHIAYADITKTGWDIGILAPMSSILLTFSTSMVVVFLVAMSVVVVMWVFTFTRRQRHAVQIEDPPG